MRIIFRPFTASLIVCCLLAGCFRSAGNQDAGTSQTGSVSIYAFNYPLKYFSEQIGGTHVRVVYPAPAHGDPAFWRPDADTTASVQTADLIVLNGASYEKWTSSVSLPDAKVVTTSAAFRDQLIEFEDAATHSHGPGGEHSHSHTAFTTWLDFKQAAAQAAAICDRLAELRPQHADEFAANFAAMEAELSQLDAELFQMVGDKNDRPVIFSHPVYQYFQRRYDLNGKSVHWEPDEMPVGKMWEELAGLLEEHPAKWMIWEGEPDGAIVERLGEMGVQSVVFDPCGNVPDDDDFIRVMHGNVENLRVVYTD